jgi:hypothetical protein
MKPHVLLRVLFTGFWVLSLLSLGWGGMAHVAGQSGTITWSEPINLSDTSSLSTHPAIVADGHGYIHVFWSEDVEGQPYRLGRGVNTGNSILYRRWDGQSWTSPIDILYVPGENIADYVAVAVGPDSMLHAVWIGQSNVYYSSAVAWQALSGHGWSKPTIIATDTARSRMECSVAVDQSNNIHVVYATQGGQPGIYHTLSRDGGSTWEPEQRLSLPFDRNEASFSTVQIVADGADHLHVVWQTNQEDGYGQAVYYARSIDQGGSWSPAQQMGYRGPGDSWMDYPYLTARGQSELHLIYEPSNIIMDMEGINGYVVPVVDGSQQMLLIINMRTRGTQVVGIYYARWSGSNWSPVVPVDVSSPAASSAHYTAATVRLGNEVHVVYNDIEAGEIWYVRGLLANVKPQPALALPEAQTSVLPTPTAAPTAVTPITRSVSGSLVPAPSLSTGFSIDSAFVLGAGTALLLVVGVILWMRVRPR